MAVADSAAATVVERSLANTRRGKRLLHDFGKLLRKQIRLAVSA